MKRTRAVPVWRQAAAWLLLAGSTAYSAAVQAEWLYREEAIMGTRCAVELWSEDKAAGEAAIDAVFADMRRIDAAMSTYKPDSEVSRVNAAAGKGPVAISAELFSLIETAQQYSQLSNGVFDITYASVGYLYDYRAHIHPDAAAIDKALPNIDYRQLKLDAVKHTIAFGKPGMRIDLGGIGKGYAVDRGIDILKARGIAHAMVNAGGDTRVMGDRLGKPWVIGIRHPDRKDEVVLRIPLVDAAFSTSGDYERYFDEGGVRYDHIIDPKTGRSPHGVRSATVIASTATRTDGLTKSVFILGPQEGIAFIDRLEDADAIVIDGRRQGQLFERPAAALRSALRTVAGSVNSKLAPASGAARAQIRPPWRMTIRCAMARPTPVPWKSRELCRRLNTPKSFSAYCMSKPAPLSSTVKMTSSPSRRPLIRIRGSGRLALYLKALLMRLDQTWRMTAGSAAAGGSDAISTVASGSPYTARDSATDVRTIEVMSSSTRFSRWLVAREKASRPTTISSMLRQPSPITCRICRPSSPSRSA